MDASEIETGKPFKRLPGLALGSGRETMRVFSELARKKCKGWKRVGSLKDKKTKNQ